MSETAPILRGGMFATLVWNRYMRESEAFKSFGIAEELPNWVAPFGEAVHESFTSEVWVPVILVTASAMLLSKLTQLSLGFLAYKITADAEKLPFPMAPVHAEGAIALAERSSETRKRGYRQYCFAVGIMCGAVFGVFYVAVPILSEAFLSRTITLLPIPFLDLTTALEDYLPGGTVGLTMNLLFLFIGFVLPWRVVLGSFVTCVLIHWVINPFVLQPNGFLPHWQPGKDAVETQVANTVDIYLSVGIGAAFAIFIAGVFGLLRSLLRHRRASGASEIDIRAMLRRNKERGDPPVWAAVGVWLAASVGFILLSNHLINADLPPGGKPFHIGWLIAFAFLWTPINTYINARMIGIAGMQAGMPYVRQAAILISGYRFVNVWFAPLPMADFGHMAGMLRVTQLTRTRFTSILKAELLIFPLMMVASFIYWSYITGLGPIPSDSYGYVQRFWPQYAQMRALWASSMQEGQSMLLEALKPEVIGFALVGATLLFGAFGLAGISTQYIYGGVMAIPKYPHMILLMFVGACLGRFVFARRFGEQKWRNYAPILTVGFGAGLGLTGMLAIAVKFLHAAVGTGY